MVTQRQMQMKARVPPPDRIKLVYHVDLGGKESLASIYFNDKGGIIPEDKSKLEGMLKKLPLSKMDKVLLEKRPLYADLSIGDFKLDTDRVENIRYNLGAHYLVYEKIL